MDKFISRVFLISTALLMVGCNSSKRGEMLLEFNSILKKEYEGDTQIADDNRWFNMYTSTMKVYKNETYQLTFHYKKDNIKKTFTGDYKLDVVSPGNSGKGWFTFDGEKLNLTFQNAFFLIFELPVKYNPAGETKVRTLHFQRW